MPTFETHPLLGLRCAGTRKEGMDDGGRTKYGRYSGMFAGLKDGVAYILDEGGKMQWVDYGSLTFQDVDVARVRLAAWGTSCR